MGKAGRESLNGGVRKEALCAVAGFGKHVRVRHLSNNTVTKSGLAFPSTSRSALTESRVETDGVQGNQLYSHAMWTLGILKM